MPGRPQSKASFINTADDPLGRDRMGSYDMKAKPSSGEDATGKTKYIGGSPLSLESKQAQIVYYTNKSMFDKINVNHKVNLFEQSNLLDEDNIISDIQ